MSKVAIIDYGSGNLRSAAKAFERAAREIGAECEIGVTSDPAAVGTASHIVLPGVGAFGDCMAGLRALPEMLETLQSAVIGEGRAFLGICVGMQLMAERGIEHGSHQGLGWIPGEVRPIEPLDPTLKIPHMGWNELEILTPSHPVLDGIGNGAYAYFVHSFAITCRDPAHVMARVEYGGPVTAVVGRDNLVGTQFHPEKSQTTGLRLIANFLKWRP